MSLILDALKKSEQQRIQSSAPQAPEAAPRPAPRRASMAPLGYWAAGAVILIGGAVLAWRQLGGTDGAMQPQAVIDTATQEKAAPDAAEQASRPALPAEAPAATASALPETAPPSAPVVDAKATAVATENTPSAAPALSGQAEDKPAVPVQEALDVQPAMAAAPSPAEEPVPQTTAAAGPPEAVAEAPQRVIDRGQPDTDSAPAATHTPAPVAQPAVRAQQQDSSPASFASLSYQVQQAVLPLDIQLHVYDDDPAKRFVMLNRATLAEGMEMKPGLRLERIVPGGVVLSWQGQRFLFTAAD